MCDIKLRKRNAHCFRERYLADEDGEKRAQSKELYEIIEERG